MKTGRLLKPLTSKLPGTDKRTQRRVGTACRMQRHSSNPGQWVAYFGKEYALIPAEEIGVTVEFA